MIGSFKLWVLNPIAATGNANESGEPSNLRYMHRESIETVYNSPSLGGKGIKGSEYNGKKIKQRGREEKGKGR